MHAKVFTSDDEKAVVGSVNLDYRSLHLHFECATYIYRNPAVGQAEQDFQETLKKCQKITLEDCQDPVCKESSRKSSANLCTADVIKDEKK